MSLSTAINTRSAAHEPLIRACNPSRLLVESDYHNVSESGPRTWEIMEVIARIRGWKVEQTEEEILADSPTEEAFGAIRRIQENWRLFEAGDHPGTPTKDSSKTRKRNKFPHEEEDWDDDDDELGTVIR